MSFDKVIIALDFSNEADALKIVDDLGELVNFYKVGLELFCSSGPSIIKKLKSLDKKVFLDLKLHDIPNTVQKAAKVCLKYDVDLLTIHTIGGKKMLEAVTTLKKETNKTKIIGVTILTSLNEDDLNELGINVSIPQIVKRLSFLAKDCNLDGVVASAQEVKFIKEICGKDFLVITPGIRPHNHSKDDQKRTVTADEAIAMGADFIVVGRAVTSSSTPKKALMSLFAPKDKNVHSAWNQ
ncbi:orotidine-5'-phosphate decarboxylase [Thermodesulfovibrio hydrogeniphilus]